MVLLTELPPEILYNVLIHVDPPDLAWMPRVSRAFYHAISQNVPLFKQVYLQNFDTPPTGSDLDWERAIKDLVRLQVVCRRSSIDDKVCMLLFHIYSFLSSKKEYVFLVCPPRTHGHDRQLTLLELS